LLVRAVRDWLIVFGLMHTFPGKLILVMENLRIATMLSNTCLRLLGKKLLGGTPIAFIISEKVCVPVEIIGDVT